MTELTPESLSDAFLFCAENKDCSIGIAFGSYSERRDFIQSIIAELAFNQIPHVAHFDKRCGVLWFDSGSYIDMIPVTSKSFHGVRYSDILVSPQITDPIILAELDLCERRPSHTTSASKALFSDDIELDNAPIDAFLAQFSLIKT